MSETQARFVSPAVIPGEASVALSRLALPLFAATTFVASSLLFLVQPMFAKMVLPRLGGSPAVWNTCILFFQTMLLVGYGYAHLSTAWLGTALHARLHWFLMLVPLTLLPLTIGTSEPPAAANPVWWLLQVLAARVGLPFLIVSTMAPLLQRWFATLPVRSAADPYFLYAASNLGSMLSLLAYPFALEPTWGVRIQTWLWSASYCLLIVLTGICAFVTWKFGSPIERSTAVSVEATPPGARLRARWIFLAFIPSSLMLGVTTHISTDLAPVPLLWVLPLAIYLATFIIAFGAREVVPARLVARLLPLVVLVAMASVAMRISAPALIPVHFAAFFCCAMVCHTELARRRPNVRHLTEFYLWISVGGALGGAFNTLVATYVFSGIHEYPLVLALACLMRPSPAYGKGKLEPWPIIAIAAVVPFTICVLLWSAGLAAKGADLFPTLFVVGVVLAVFASLANRPAPFNALMSTLAVLVVVGFTGAKGNVLFAGRSFFGVMKVLDAPDHSYHVLQHGTTAHGRQDTAAAARCEPKAYFHPAGPIGQLLSAPGARFRTAAIVGLGGGSLACYAPPGGAWTFYEIDPLVEQIARDPKLFTFLANSPGSVSVTIGDGRLKLQQAPAASFDLIVLDAFSSDSVPVHLVTREALRMYFSRLKPDGVVVFNISNRYLDLEPVLAALAREEGLFALANLDLDVPADHRKAGRMPSHWAFIARTEASLAMFRGHRGWRTPQARAGVRPWTDDYSNLLNILKVGD
jgi:hypothetical protein